MELSWTTFVLELVNFLVLVWILKRFLYQPVLDVIARRRASIEKTLSDAKATRADAEQLRVKYENRLSDWQAERTKAYETLQREIEEERSRLRAKLDKEIETEQKKARAVEERRIQDALRRHEETALRHGASFASRLLSKFADEHLHEKLVALTSDALSNLSEDQRQSMRRAHDSSPKPVKITTALELSDDCRAEIEHRLRNVLGDETRFEYVGDATLKAGLRIAVDSWLLKANLEDELKAFVESAHETT